jgi:hypothetical protein
LDPDASVEVTLLLVQGKYERLETLLKFLNDNGAYVNHTCGVHVHIDQRHNDKKEALKIYSKLQNAVAPMLTKMVDMTRLIPEPGRTNYCALNKNIKNKYQAINFLSYSSKRTIEVRLHHGCLDFKTITNWVETLLAICESKGLQRPKVQKDFGQVLKLLTLSDEKKAYLSEVALLKLTTADLDVISEA